MLSTFVIGLREGLEAALIVGIIAAFLKRNAGLDALRRMWVGVGLAVLLCLAVGIILQLVSDGLPQRQQEMLECVIAAVAVAMITYMILWMNKHSRGLKGELESAAAGALASGSSKALVLMAFLAVVREGFETAVFLVAAFQNAISPTQAVIGITLGISVALVLGYLVYRGGTRLNLSRFFRITGVVLVLVAGGLVISTLRAAFEAGWLTAGQQVALDLSSVLAPGSIGSSLMGGIFGIQPKIAVVELVGWLLFVIPMMTVVTWPRRRRLTAPAAGKLLLMVGAGAVIAALALNLFVPRPAGIRTGVQGPFEVAGATSMNLDLTSGAAIASANLAGSVQVEIVADSGTSVTARVTAEVAGGRIDETVELVLAGHSTVAGAAATDYLGTGLSAPVTAGAAGFPDGVTGTVLASLNNGRPPIGLKAADLPVRMAAAYTDTWKPLVQLDERTRTVLGVQLGLVRTLQFTTPAGISLSGGTVLAADVSLPAGIGATLAAEVLVEDNTATRREIWGSVIPIEIGVAGACALLVGLRLRRYSKARPAPPARIPVPVL